MTYTMTHNSQFNSLEISFDGKPCEAVRQALKALGCDIGSVESKFHKGDKLISDDCFFYTLRLKDGTSVTVTLYAYGKEAEKEIWETIQSSIV